MLEFCPILRVTPLPTRKKNVRNISPLFYVCWHTTCSYHYPKQLRQQRAIGIDKIEPPHPWTVLVIFDCLSVFGPSNRTVLTEPNPRSGFITWIYAGNRLRYVPETILRGKGNKLEKMSYKIGMQWMSYMRYVLQLQWLRFYEGVQVL